ncbi:recombinase family protein [Rhodococcus erythropolis]|uniref:recombinase family protein n=1 Tax=Rhodococcus erythropolis TaxID=1833 RepID=UPI00210DA341|nr:recombinase family protein [Rhodococcus erythropolis]
MFTDYESGSKTQRPQLTAYLNYLRENDGDVLVVWKLDRLGRSVLHVIDTVHNLGECGIAFRFLAEGFDTTTAGGEFLFRIMAALAQMERRMIVERTHAGLEAAHRHDPRTLRTRSRPPRTRQKPRCNSFDTWCRTLTSQSSEGRSVWELA